MANRRPDQNGRGKVSKAIRDGLAVGFRRHLPGAVGLVTKGLPLCAFLAFAHFVLDVEWPPSLLLGALGGAAGALFQKLWP